MPVFPYGRDPEFRGVGEAECSGEAAVPIYLYACVLLFRCSGAPVFVAGQAVLARFLYTLLANVPCAYEEDQADDGAYQGCRRPSHDLEPVRGGW